jgi:AcrR family transcriptional regulator
LELGYMSDADVSGEETVRLTRAELAAATRQRIVTGAHQLLRERPYEDVTLVGIATAARVSHQTVLNHFESKDGVIIAVLDAVQRETAAMLSAPQPGDVEAAVTALVGVYEQMGDIVVGWSSSIQHSPEAEQAMVDWRDYQQHWLIEVFAGSLPAGTAARRRMIAGLTAATDVYVWKLLRRDLRRSRDATEDVVRDLILGALNGPTS